MTNKTKDIYIVGAGGFGREVLALINRINQVCNKASWCVKGFVEKSEHPLISNIPVISDEQFLGIKLPVSVVIAVGLPSVRSGIIHNYKQFTHLNFPNLIDPDALILDETSVIFGGGNIICAGTVFTTSIKIGDFNVFNLSCTVGHDCVVGSNNVINPSVNVSGGVSIGDGCLIGTGAQILQQLTVANYSIVGAGAVVVKDVEQSSTVVGVPAKRK